MFGYVSTLVLSFVATLVFASGSNSPVDANTLLLLKFESSLNGEQGETPTQATGHSFQAGIQGQGVLLLDNNQIFYPSANNINLLEGTVEFWIKPTWNGNDGQNHAILRWDIDGGTGVLIQKDGANNFKIIVDRFGTNPGGETAFNTFSWLANEWHHVAFTYSASQASVNVYVDGTLRNSESFTGSTSSVSSTIQLGGSGQGQYANAVLDNFAISNIARSQQEIAASYVSSATVTSLTADPNALQMLPTWQRTPILQAVTNQGTINVLPTVANWQSSNPSVATFNTALGKIVAHAAGTADLTATLNGQSAVIHVTVTTPVPRPRDLDVTYIERTPRYNYNAAKNNPAPGETVTFVGHIRTWQESVPSVDYVWHLDGEPVSHGTLTNLSAGQESVVTLQWIWQAGPHNISLTVDPANGIAESSELNNKVSDRTDGVSIGFWIEESVYSYFQANQYNLGIGSNSWEDWAQRQVALWNEFNAKAVYPLTPQGVTDRVRLDKITIVPDGALPLNGGLPGNNPDTTDLTIDMQWGFPSGPFSDEFYANTTSLDRANPFYIEQSLIHEMGHARYLIDYYAMDIANSPENQNVQIIDGGTPVAGTPLMPYLAFDSVLHYNVNGGVMGGPYSFAWSPHEAKALELIAGKRALNGNMNAPGNIGVYLQDLPLQNHLRIADLNGSPLAGANVRFYGAVPVSGLYNKVINNTPEFTLTTDANGYVDFPQNPFTDAPNSYWNWVPVGTAVLRIEHNGNVWYRFWELTDLNFEYWRGHTDHGYYTLELPVPGSGPVMQVLGYDVPIASGDNSPSVADRTDFGVVNVSSSATHTFVIKNRGDQFLQLTGNPQVEIAGSGAGHFELYTLPHIRLGANQITTFQIRYTPSNTSTNTATVRIQYPGGTYEFAVSGHGTVSSSPTPTPSPSPVPFVEVSGQVLTSNSLGLRNAKVTMDGASQATRTAVTSSLGYFIFDNVAANQTVTFRINSRRYRFEPKEVPIVSGMQPMTFVGLE